MLKPKSSRLTVAVAAVAALVLLAGGTAIASNMGFKMNKVVVLAGAGQTGSNWTSIPYNSPYTTAGEFCRQTGLTAAGILRASVVVLNENTGAFTTVSCGSAAADALALIPGKGLQFRQPNVTGAVTSIILVGSHNPSLSITIPDAGAGQIGSLWFSVPYHTTAVTANDICLQAGMTSTGIIRGSLVRLNAATGAFTTVSCGSAAAAALSLVLGEHVQLREPNGPKTFVPAHF